MKRIKTSIKGSFLAGLCGGVAAVALGLALVGGGVIDLDDDGGNVSTVAAAPVETDAQPASSNSRTVGQVFEEDGQGVAFIEAEQSGSSESPIGEPQQGGTATGSGFLIDDQGHILTNAHVVDGSKNITVKFGDGDAVDATLLGADDSTDVAILSVDPGDVDAKPLELGDSSAVKVGDGAIAIGNPYGLDRTVTSGIISALQRQISAPNGFTISDVIQTDAAINPGNSGGPLIDSAGRVVGINSQIATGSSSTGSVGIGFAVPINTAKSVAEQIIDGDGVEHAFLGISGGDLDPTLADVLNLSVDEGALVQNVTPDSPAAEAGLEGGEGTVRVDGARVRAGGDVITAIDGEPIAGMDDLIAMINTKQPGDEVTLSVLRDSETQQIKVELTDRPAQADG